LKTTKVPWHWVEVHQKAVNDIKAIIARDVALAYLDYSKEFEIYTDTSSRQMGAVLTQQNRPIVFFSRKLSTTQQNYSVTEIELLAIVETIKKFKGMLWGHKIKVYTDHKSLIQDILGLTSDRVYRWWLLLEEYGPEIIHIKGIHNTVADAISHLDYCPVQNHREMWITFTQCWCYYASHTSTRQQAIHPASMNLVFANCSEWDVIYPLTVKEIAEAQETDPNIQKLTTDPQYTRQLVENTQVLCKGTTIVLLAALWHRAISWYHHYLQHPGATHLKKTHRAAMYWKGMRNTIQKYIKNCHK
jgi:hypothetical protein